MEDELRREANDMGEGRKSDEQPRGRLAEVIATRGGLAPPEAPFVIERDSSHSRPQREG
jgi:hypothetical protein